MKVIIEHLTGDDDNFVNACWELRQLLLASSTLFRIERLVAAMAIEMTPNKAQVTFCDFLHDRTELDPVVKIIQDAVRKYLEADQ